MSSCKYKIKDKVFDSEFELDAYLLARANTLKSLGDSVFSRETKANNNINTIKEVIVPKTKELKKKHKGVRYIDGEEILETEKPYVGVLDFLSNVVIDGVRLFPEFIEDYKDDVKGYWPRRIERWTGKVEPDEHNPKWTKDEIDLFFGGDEAKAEATTLNPKDTDTIKLYRLLMTKKWKEQARFGTAIHAALSYCFSPSNERGYTGKPRIFLYRNQPNRKLVDAIRNRQHNGVLPNDGMTDFILDLTISYAKTLWDHIRNNVCPGQAVEDFEIYSELDVSAKLTTEIDSKAPFILGTIDLLIVDKYGNAHIFDFKTSPKTYDEYYSAKKATFMYLLNTYRHILNTNGVNTVGSTINILPILLLGFKLNNPDDAFNIEKTESSYKGVENAKFSYDRIKYDDANLVRNLDESLVSKPYIEENVNTFLPHYKVVDISIDDVVTNVTKNQLTWFSGNEALGWTDEGIIELIKEKKADVPQEDGKYHFKLGALFMKEIVADNEAELVLGIKKEIHNQESKLETVVTVTTKALDESMKADGSVGRFIIPSKTYEEHATLEWSEDIFHRYMNGNWVRLKTGSWPSILETYGIIALRNEVTGLYDFIKLSVNNLKDSRIFGSKMKRKYLTGSFQTDELVESDTTNHALPAVQGFVETMEVMNVINNIVPSLPEGGFIGRILVVNPFHGQGVSATNEQIRWNYDKFVEHYGLTEADYITVKDAPIKFLKGYELAYQMLREAMITESLTKAFKGDTYRTHINALDSFILNGNKEKAISELLAIAKLMETTYPYLKTVEKGTAAEAKCRAIYNQVLIGIANLQEVQFDVQIKDHDKYMENKGIKSILTQGMTGTYIDNPGNLSSDTLNLITKLVTQSYQLVRLDMVEPKTKLRELLTKLKERKGYSKLKLLTGDWRLLYGNMFREDSEDIYFKNPWTDSTLIEEEREFLQYIIPEMLSKRPGLSYTKEELIEELKKDKLELYQVPLAKGGVKADVAEYGMLLGLKNRLKFLDPKTWSVDAIKQWGLERFNDMLAEATGDFNIDTKSSADSTLFEMANYFDLGSNQTTRKLALKKHGIYYFEHDLETLFLRYEYADSMKKRVNAVFPTIKAAMIYLAKSGWELNTEFANDLKYLEDYINANIKNKNIWANTEEQKINAGYLNEIKKVASFMTLAFSPVLFTYQSFQGLLLTISIYLRKPDGGKYDMKTFMKAFRFVYSDLFLFSDKPTKCLLINELYSINDMDMNVYAEHLKLDLTGFTNFAYKFASRPDYYNRMLIIVTKMIDDGSWDAFEEKDGKLVYDITKDARYSAFMTGDKSDIRKYNELKALYLANYKLFKDEGVELPPLDLNNPAPLPLPYTNQEMESIKSICDLVYGYYTHEKKSMVHNLMLGSLFMQMRTYWSGKKNLYLAPGGVKLLGEWRLLTNDAGQPLYYQIIDGIVRTDLPPTTEVTDVPFLQWKGKFQEGIILTLAVERQAALENIRDYGIIQGISKTFGDLKNAEDWETYYRRLNLKQLGYDVTAYMLFGLFIANALRARSRELALLAKQEGNAMTGLTASLAYIGYRTISNAASDFNFLDGILSPLTVSITPFSFNWWGSAGNNIVQVLFGDRTIIKGLSNTMAVTRQFKPFFDVIDNELHE